jgi:phosphodiesterase/alkaline phosphatase D-like protein
VTRPLARVMCLTAVFGLLLGAPALAARGFSFGVASGEVTSGSAILWAHADASGSYRLEVS